MSGCLLGSKKKRIIEKLTGKKVDFAFVRGGWEHFWACVNFVGEEYDWSKGKPQPFVNYKTGEVRYPKTTKQRTYMPETEQQRLFDEAVKELEDAGIL
ncbi:MAG: hypothetical protein GY853_13270 [PVC group bacterium]|nr:hypothetical protein [PVC group bacterium]